MHGCGHILYESTLPPSVLSGNLIISILRRNPEPFERYLNQDSQLVFDRGIQIDVRLRGFDRDDQAVTSRERVPVEIRPGPPPTHPRKHSQ